MGKNKINEKKILDNDDNKEMEGAKQKMNKW